jgi:pimeloyl-ACP methyl ester carboxylesterase
MKSREVIRAALGVLLCVAGFVLARSNPYRETTVIVNAGGCRLVTDIVDAGSDATQGSVVLLHGLAANKKIMSYLAYGFAQQNLRVFVPDLPGHGRTPGPFSYARAEECSEALVRQLIARGAIDSARTLLVGHSMGGAIAVRVAARVPVAGVIAISPAPMSTGHGVPAEMLPYENPPPTPPHTLAMSAAWEPSGIRDSAQDLIAGPAAESGKYVLIPRATHVSVLFDSRVVRASQEWATQVLHLPPGGGSPSSLMVAGSLAGFAGLFLLAGPFIRESLGVKSPGSTGPRDRLATRALVIEAPATTTTPPLRLLLEVALASVLTVILLRFWEPLRAVRVFEGGYFVSFLLVLGIALLLFHRRQVTATPHARWQFLLGAAFAAMVLHLLVTGWSDLTISEAWFTAGRWLRFPPLLAAVLPYHTAEELFLDFGGFSSAKTRLAAALVARVIAWAALVAGLFLLHNGEILLVLLAPYLAVFCVLQRVGMGVVRKSTGSALAAALFGAILLAGFCLVIFPIT